MTDTAQETVIGPDRQLVLSALSKRLHVMKQVFVSLFLTHPKRTADGRIHLPNTLLDVFH